MAATLLFFYLFLSQWRIQTLSLRGVGGFVLFGLPGFLLSVISSFLTHNKGWGGGSPGSPGPLPRSATISYYPGQSTEMYLQSFFLLVVVVYIGCKKEKESEGDTYSSFLSLAFATKEFSAM